MKMNPTGRDKQNPEKEKVLRELSREEEAVVFAMVPRSLKQKLKVHLGRNGLTMKDWVIEIIEKYIAI